MKCEDCKFWNRLKDTEHSNDMGECLKLSAPEGDEYPETEETGIDSTPLSYHDGRGVFYETKSWFGCVHFTSKKP